MQDPKTHEKQKEPEVFYYRNHWEERNTNKEYLNYVRQYNLEEHFNIIIEDAAVDRIDTVEDIYKELRGILGN